MSEQQSKKPNFNVPAIGKPEPKFPKPVKTPEWLKREAERVHKDLKREGKL